MTNVVIPLFLPLALLALLSAATGEWHHVLAAWLCGQIVGVLSLQANLIRRVPGPFWQLAAILVPQLGCVVAYGLVADALPVSLLTGLTLMLGPPISIAAFCKLTGMSTTIEHLFLSSVGPAILATPPPSTDCWICGQPNGHEAFERSLAHHIARGASSPGFGWVCLACDYQPPEEPPNAEGTYPESPRKCPKCGACRGCTRTVQGSP